ncbi:MAG TPA: ATP-binding cassette domain-containing protein [Candidatus Bathyarchaeia archaeon]|nr:ATP-binding cassette domain-containing protein [Candidatus Bathyarchaeia archaeon]
MREFIRFEDVHFHYTEEKPVLKGINLKIAQGEFVALIGGNGSGKTTLSKHCNGLYRPTAGTVFVDGIDTNMTDVASLTPSVAYCYQNPDHQIFHSTIKEEVAFGPKNLGLTAFEIEERVKEALQAVDLWELRQEEPFFVSKGTRQKIAVASILAMRPKGIVLDEPTTGLDHRGVQEMMRLIASLHQEGHTILVVTHDMQLVAEYASRVIVMAQGEIMCDGTPQEVFARQDLLDLAQVEAPPAARFAASIGLPAPLPLTLAALKERLAADE